MKIIKKIIFSLFLLISFVYIFIIVSPKIIKGFYPFGIKTAVILTGSMEPTLNINDFVIMKKPNSIKVGNIVSYKVNNSDNEVLHRVIKVNNNEIITKGDANNTEDQAINKNQVTGIYICKIKFLGNVISFIKKPIVFSSIITLLLILLLIPNKKENKK